MPSIGVCSLCQTKCVAVWVTDPCKHEACYKCLTSRGSITTCFECKKKFKFLRCPGSQYGCQFNASQGTWEQHEVKCTFLPVECPYRCGVILSKKTLSRHIIGECPLRLATCRYCQDSVFQVELDDHEKSCPEAPISCPFCPQGNIKRGRLSDHAKTCQKTPKPCPLNKYGCGFVGLDTVMDEHLNVKNHVPCFQKLNTDMEERDTEIARLRAHVDTLKNEMKEFFAAGVVPFDEELKWTVILNHSRGTSWTSPIYKHRNTKTSFCFTLTFFDNGYSMTLKQYLLAEEDSSEDEQFMVKVEKKSSGQFSEIDRRDGIVCKDQKLLDWRHGNETIYVVTFVEKGNSYRVARRSERHQ
ncbi:TNF receptor-associated factor 4-like [Ornithodoros turicata]|uniref:TNF receptor-associated factor 4-like n=1 Tax=Ornithodoros turicata TaxID=34597 RepID=UPI0031392DF3